MEIFRFLFFTVAFIGLVLSHATLFVWNEAFNVWSRASGDGWHIECVYYTPFRLFKTEVFLGQDCPTRISAPDSPRSQGHFTLGGMDERIESTLPPVFRPKIVPRS